MTEEELSEACREYGEKLDDLYSIMEDLAPKMQKVSSLASEVRAIKLRTQEAAPAPDSPEVRAALENAKAISDQFGATSPEARVAWAELEEIASSGLSNAIGTRLDEGDCLVDPALDSCQALEELNRALRARQEQEQT